MQRGHLLALPLSHLVFGKQDDDVDVIQFVEGVRHRAAGVARRGGQNQQFAIVLLEKILHEPPNHPRREILE